MTVHLPIQDNECVKRGGEKSAQNIEHGRTGTFFSKYVSMEICYARCNQPSCVKISYKIFDLSLTPPFHY